MKSENEIKARLEELRKAKRESSISGQRIFALFYDDELKTLEWVLEEGE